MTQSVCYVILVYLGGTLKNKIQVKLLESEQYATVNSALRELMESIDSNLGQIEVDVVGDLLLLYQEKIDNDNCIDTKLKYNVISRLLKE